MDIVSRPINKMSFFKLTHDKLTDTHPSLPTRALSIRDNTVSGSGIWNIYMFYLFSCLITNVYVLEGFVPHDTLP